MKGNRTLRICLVMLLLIISTAYFANAEARVVECEGQSLIVISEEDLKEILIMGEELTSMKKENTVLQETIKEYSVIHSKMVSQITKLSEEYEAASRVRSIFVGVAIVTSLAALGGVLLW